ncbi:polysaccharide pyruvyl transferase family protein [Microbacterium sp. NPDC079995]|uniref:polysaccharide pyruvyl transferase family protein n=1 Tax=unclassified Microbacterium TaxID=2609290 RepID=UPI00344B8C77
MRILLAWTDETSPNLGVRALGRGSQDLLRRIWPNAEFTYMNYGSKPEPVTWSPRGLVREWVTGRRGMRDWIDGFDLYWDTRSGDSFSDIYGLPRHMTMSMIHEFAARRHVPTILAPQTIGPFGSRRSRILARRDVTRSRLVLARDPLSAAASARLGRPVDLTTTDLVFGIDQPVPEPGHDVLLNVSGLLWRSARHGDPEVYRRQIESVIDGLLDRGRSITLFPHVLDSPDPDNDVPVARELHERYEGRVGLVVPRDLEHARAVIAGASVVIGARMHACLNALSTGTPAIAMAYSRKFAPLMNELGWPHVVDAGAGDDAAERIVAAVDDPQLAEHARKAQRRGQQLLADVQHLVEAVR